MTFQFLADIPAGIPSAEEQTMGTILMFGAMFVIFYFLIIRPQQKKAKQHQALVSSIEKHDKVITAGGIYGVVTKAAKDDGLLTVEIAEGVEIKVLSDTIATVMDDVKAKPTNDNKDESKDKKKKKNKKKNK